MLRNVSGSCRLRDASGAQSGAPLEQAAQRPEAGRQAGVRAGGFDRGMQHRQVRAETLQAQRTRHVERIEEAAEVGQRQRGPRGRERVAGDEREALARGQLDVGEHRAGQVGERCQVRLAHRAEDAHRRRFGEREDLDEPLGQERPDAGKAAREGVQLEQERRPHDVGRGERALRHPVVADHPLRVGVRVGPLERDALEHADRRRHPVRGRAGREHILDDGAGPAHLLASGRVEAHRLAVASDAHELVERQRSAGDQDAHGAASLRQAPRAMRLQ